MRNLNAPTKFLTMCFIISSCGLPSMQNTTIKQYAKLAKACSKKSYIVNKEYMTTVDKGSNLKVRNRDKLSANQIAKIPSNKKVLIKSIDPDGDFVLIERPSSLICLIESCDNISLYVSYKYLDPVDGNLDCNSQYVTSKSSSDAKSADNLNDTTLVSKILSSAKNNSCSYNYGKRFSVNDFSLGRRTLLSFITDPKAEGTGNCYNTTFAFRKFTTYNRHPNKVICSGVCSSAAGRHQFLFSTWNAERKSRRYKKLSGFKRASTKFGPSQQEYAILSNIHSRGLRDTDSILNKTTCKRALDTLSRIFASIPIGTSTALAQHKKKGRKGPGRYGQIHHLKTPKKACDLYKKYLL